MLLSYKGCRAWQRAEQGRPGAEAPDRGRGGKATKRGLSHEQVPILVAASGAVVSAVLPGDSADAIKAVLDPVLSKDALLVTDGGTALACCATGMKISHEVLNQSAGERVRGELHIQTVNSLHERIKTFLRARRGHQIPRQLPAMVPSLQHAPTPRACLNAAIGPQLKMAVPT